MFARATRALSVYQEYLALERGRPSFTQDFTSLALLRVPLELGSLRVRAYHPVSGFFPEASARVPSPISGPYNPGRQADRFRLWRFRSPLLAPSHSISPPPATKMFQFTGFASLAG